MTKKNLIALLVLLLLFVLSAGLAYYFGPQIRNELRVQEWREKYYVENPVGKITTPHVSSVNISGCKAEPRTLLTHLNSQLRFVNNDDRGHMIYFRQKNFLVPANGYVDVAIDFFSNPGDKGYYDCDSSKYVGMISTYLNAPSSAGVTATTTSATTTKKAN